MMNLCICLCFALLGYSTGKQYTSSSAMAERPRELGDFKGWVNLTLNFWLKGYVSRQ